MRRQAGAKAADGSRAEDAANKKATGLVACGIARSSKNVVGNCLVQATFEKRAARDQETAKTHNARCRDNRVEHEVVDHDSGANLAFVEFADEDAAEEAAAHSTLTMLARRVNRGAQKIAASSKAELKRATAIWQPSSRRVGFMN